MGQVQVREDKVVSELKIATAYLKYSTDLTAHIWGGGGYASV